MDSIFHVALASDWHAAQTSRAYHISTRDRTLADVGFIHASYARQVAGVANAYYAGVRGLVLLVIDRQRVLAPVRDEHVSGTNDAFPHIYGPLNLDAVVDVLPFEPAEDGTFSLPNQLQT